MAGVLNDEAALIQIFVHLDTYTLCKVEQVCKLWQDLASCNTVWKHHVERLCRNRKMKAHLGRAGDWKTRYKQLVLGRLYPRIIPKESRKPTYEENLSALQPIPKEEFVELMVKKRIAIKDFIQSATNKKYKVGNAYYKHTKSETIGFGKKILLQDKKSKALYCGPAVRNLLGLVKGTADWNITPNKFDVRVTDSYNIYVQSKSVGRMLVPRTELLYTDTPERQ